MEQQVVNKEGPRSKLQDHSIGGTLNIDLKDACFSNSSIVSSIIGDSPKEIARCFSRHSDGEQQMGTPKKCHVRWIDIPRRDSNGARQAPLRWIDVERPNEDVLEGLSRKFNIKYADLIRCIKEGHPPNSYRYSRYLVNRLDEMDLNPDPLPSIRAKTICAFMGEDFLITISAGDSVAISRVMKEVRDGEAPVDEISSSNYLCSRLLGAILHLNEAVTERLDEYCSKFIERHSKGLPGEEELKTVSSLAQNLAKALHATQGTDTIMCALQEKRNLFGSASPRDALGRYHGMLTSTTRSLDLTKQAIENLRDAWQDQGDRWRNDILFKIALLTGAVSLPSMAAGLFGMNFSYYPIPDQYIWGGVAASAVLSFGLVLRLLQSRRLLQQ